MEKKIKNSQYTGYRRPSVALTEEEHREIAHYCIDQGMKIGEFLKEAALYCARNEIAVKQLKD